MKDLEGKTLLPVFIDPHSHFMSSLAMGSQANCQPAPAGEGNSIAGIVKALQKIKIDKNIPDGDTIVGYGYDNNAMPNGVLLNRDDLDKAFPNNPVIIIHASMHGVVLNSKAMKNFNIDSKTQTVDGVVIDASERITPYRALQAITTNVAYQYFEENSKGSLKAGKLTDLVILNQHRPSKTAQFNGFWFK
jgi:predicted amidohydrolase YtcJ